MNFELKNYLGWPPAPPQDVLTKSDWRRCARAARSDSVVLPDPSTKQELVGFVAQTVPAGSLIVGYDALAGEYDVSSVLTQLDSLGWPAGLVRTPDEGHDLTIHPFDSDRETHRFGFSQPVLGSVEISIDSIGAVLVPCLALDLKGTRLGFGAGYFDRFLARVIAGVPLIGLATLPPVDRLPSEGHDVPMTHLGVSDGSGFKVRPVGSSR